MRGRGLNFPILETVVVANCQPKEAESDPMEQAASAIQLRLVARLG